MNKLVIVSEFDFKIKQQFLANLKQLVLPPSVPQINQYTKEFLKTVIGNDTWIKLPPTSELISQTKTKEDWYLITATTDILCYKSSLEHCINWNAFSEYQQITPEIGKKYKDNLVWELVSRNPNTTYYEHINWDVFSEYIYIDDLEKVSMLQDKLNWEIIVKTNKFLSHEFIVMFDIYIPWDLLKDNVLEIDTILEYHDFLDMSSISKQICLVNTENIYKARHVLDWNQISERKLSSEFIMKFYKYLDWKKVSKQVLEDCILDQFENVIDWYTVYKNKSYPITLKKKYSHRMWWDKKL